MRLAPSMDIIHEFAQHFLVDIVENGVVGTEDEVGWGLLQNLVDLGLQLAQIAVAQGLTAVVESAQDGTAEQTADVGQAEALVLPVVERRVDDAAGIVEIVVEGLGGEVSAALADMEDVERSHLCSDVAQLAVVGLDDVCKHALAELLEVVALTGDVEAVGAGLAGFADVVDQALRDGLEGGLDGLGVLLDEFDEVAPSLTVAAELQSYGSFFVPTIPLMGHSAYHE